MACGCTARTSPKNGHRCNPNKLLVDPYAKALSRARSTGRQPVLGYQADGETTTSSSTSATAPPACPRAWSSTTPSTGATIGRPTFPGARPSSTSCTSRASPSCIPASRKSCAGPTPAWRHPAAIEHLKIARASPRSSCCRCTSSPTTASSRTSSLRNYWGYSTLGYFAPEQRYASRRQPGRARSPSSRRWSRRCTPPGIEVILDVVYNHTCEGNHLGPTLSLKGIDNATYYWLMPEPALLPGLHRHRQQPQRLEPRGRPRLIVDSLRYWVNEMHVDGFRFDLATTLGRGRQRASSIAKRPFFQIIDQDPVLSRVKLIAEPWDLGLGGYQVGNFPAPLARVERQVPRRHPPLLEGRRQPGRRGRLPAGRVRRSLSGRTPAAAGQHQLHHRPRRLHAARPGHLRQKHNDANGERNSDGADDNQSWNHGVEGETDDAGIIALRERQKRNLLATLFLSQGVPMLLARRRDGPHPARQQQRLLPGQRAVLVRLEPGRSAQAAARLHPPDDRAAPQAARCCSAGISFAATTSGTRSSKDICLVSPRRHRDDAGGLAAALRARAGVRAGRRRHPDRRRARAANHRRFLAGAAQRSSRTGGFSPARGQGRPGMAAHLRHRTSSKRRTRPSKAATGWKAGPWRCSVSRPPRSR